MPQEVNDTPLPESPKEPAIDTQTSPIIVNCTFSPCTEENVTRCRKCNRPFCIMHANRFSPNFCKECFSNLSLVEAKFERQKEDFDLKTNTLIIKKETNTKYYLDGIDWPFYTAWIDKLNDDELNILIRFHYFIMKTIEAENDTRKVEKYRKLREQPTPVRLVTVKTVTKTTKQVDTKEDVIKKLTKQGLPQNVIDMMIQAMKF